MPAPSDPYDLQNLVSIVDAAQIDLRFKRLFDALDKTKVGLDGNSFKDGAFTAAKFPLQAWQTLTLGGIAWTPTTLAYYKDAAGYVRFRNSALTTVAALAGGTVVGTLPVGYRPGSTQLIIVWSLNNTPEWVQVAADGTMTVLAASGSIPAGTVIFHGSFRAEG